MRLEPALKQSAQLHIENNDGVSVKVMRPKWWPSEWGHEDEQQAASSVQVYWSHCHNSETSLYPWTLPVLYILHYQPAAWECVQDAASFNPYWQVFCIDMWPMKVA